MSAVQDYAIGTVHVLVDNQHPTWTAPANITGSQQSCSLSVGVNDGAGGIGQSSSYQQGINGDTQAPIGVRVTAPTRGQRIAGIFSL